MDTMLKVGAGSYPAVANSLLWIDRFRSATDASGLVLAVDGESVQTISLPSGGWGSTLGNGLVVQATGADRPTYRTAGLQGNGTSTLMTLPSALSLSGAFTAWVVLDFNGAVNPDVYGMSGNSGAYGGVLVDFNVNVLRCYSDDASTYIQSVFYTPTKAVIRIRRTAANAMYFAGTGLAEIAKSSTTYTWAIDRIFRRGGSVPSLTNSGVRLCQWVVVGADAVTDGTSTAVETKLLALEGVSL